MTHEFVRFVASNRTDPDSGTAIGIVAVAYELAESDKVARPRRDQLVSLLRWIESNVPLPRRFNRTKSKGWYRRNTRGISWLRVTAEEHLETFRSLADVVKQCGCSVTELHETRIGYITHEDDVQAVAEPFRETRTR